MVGGVGVQAYVQCEKLERVATDGWLHAMDSWLREPRTKVMMALVLLCMMGVHRPESM